jgi:hypothetical protein
MVKLIIQNSKFKTQNQLYCQNLSTSQVHHSPFTNHHSPLTTHHSPITIHHSPLTTHQSPITNHQSPFTTHQSPFTNHHSPLTIHQSPFTTSQKKPLPRQGLLIIQKKITSLVSSSLCLYSDRTSFCRNKRRKPDHRHSTGSYMTRYHDDH